MLKQVNGWLWPASDTECQKVAYDLTALKTAISYCNGFKVAVQAGGNVGVWPKYLAGVFGTVYTAEPDPDNFACLVANVIEPNVIKLQCGFGYKIDGPMNMIKKEGNCGAGHMFGSGAFPVIRIDDLSLRNMDLLCLDIEGMEPQALKGCDDLISQHKPIILLEQKGHEARYGSTADDIQSFMEQHDYRVADRVHRDVIWVPK